MLVLMPHVRSQGIGAKLVAEINRLSHQAGYRLGLRVFRTNGAAKRFYEREGWRVETEDDTFFVMTGPLYEAGKVGKPAGDLHAMDFEFSIPV
jgi:ribosomal protein S18 acetylase RimI-like enzyme